MYASCHHSETRTYNIPEPKYRIIERTKQGQRQTEDRLHSRYGYAGKCIKLQLSCKHRKKVQLGETFPSAQPFKSSCLLRYLSLPPSLFLLRPSVVSASTVGMCGRRDDGRDIDQKRRLLFPSLSKSGPLFSVLLLPSPLLSFRSFGPFSETSASLLSPFPPGPQATLTLPTTILSH